MSCHLQNRCSGLSYGMNTRQRELDEKSVQTQRVAIGEPVWVQCDGFRCLAYLSQRGEWRTYADNAKLTNVIKILDPSFDE